MTLQVESFDLEYSLLFLIFKHPENFAKYTSEIDVDCFANIHTKKYFKCIIEENIKNKTTISIQAAQRLLESNAETDDDKICIKSCFDKIVNTKAKDEDYQTFVDRLKELSGTRAFLKSIRRTTDDIINSNSLQTGITNLEENLQNIKRKISKVSDLGFMKLKGDVDKRIEYANKVRNNPIEAGLVGTGFKNFDKFLPMIPKGSFYLYLARPNIGKSMFLMGTALYNYEVLGVDVVYFTIEMSAREVAYRMDSNITGFNQNDIVMGKLETKEDQDLWKTKVVNFGKGKAKNDLDIYWIPGECTCSQISNIIASLPYKPGLVVVDYAGDMDVEDKKLSKYDPKAQALIYDGLKKIAQKLETVVFSAQQIKRGEGKKRVDTESGYGSDKSSQRADVMISIEVTKEDEMFQKEINSQIIEGRMTIQYVKNRNGFRLKTHIVPMFYKMNWLEDEFDSMVYADSAIKYSEKKKKSPLADPTLENKKEVSEDIVLDEQKEKTDLILDALV
jgi:replicative DNA helicase